jgi:hypothetical protein
MKKFITALFQPGIGLSSKPFAFILLSILLTQAGMAQRSLDKADFAPFKADKEEFMNRRAEAIGFKRGIEKDKPFDPAKRIIAVQQMEEQKMQRSSRRGSYQRNILAPWLEIGPNPIPNGQVVSGPQLPVSGRTISIAVHPTNPDILYVGTAQGGLYRSLNGGTTWVPLMDNALSLAINTVAIAASQPNTIFVGTGEANFSSDSYLVLAFTGLTMPIQQHQQLPALSAVVSLQDVPLVRLWYILQIQISFLPDLLPVSAELVLLQIVHLLIGVFSGQQMHSVLLQPLRN